MVKLLLCDIDGTLCQPMEQIKASMINALQTLKDAGWEIGVVGGSDRAKALYQLRPEVIDRLLDHAFHENGTVYYQKGTLVAQERLEDFISPDTVIKLTRFLLGELSTSKSPIVTGTFIERRSCMLNVSPCGRACTPTQREEFFQWDKTTGCRKQLVASIRQAFPDIPLEIAVGGMISIDIYPKGLDKTRCLQYLKNYEEIHFIGDRVEPGGNDAEIYAHPRVRGYKTSSPEETEKILASLAKIAEKSQCR